MIYTRCQMCGARLQLPNSATPGSSVRCPSCKHIFHPEISRQPPKLNRSIYGKFFGITIAGLVLLAVGLLASWLLGTKRNSLRSTRITLAGNSLQQVTYRPPRWIRANYRGLVDFSQLTQNGKTIRATMAGGIKEGYQRGQLQPFLDQFSRLLPQALETAEGLRSEMPRVSVVAELPSDSPQPAWAALLRGGSIVVTDDGNGLASVFVPGTDAQQAYNSSYSVVRHVLQALVPSDGQPLKVRAFAYQNDYASCELKLCLDDFKIEATDFPPPPGKMPLDLDSLREFFKQGMELEGGSIDSKNNLVLVGKKGGPQTLASKPVELADLAVAYRAVFHAGDNHAFISLDPNSNPTLVNVNFGGFLEDTRIGAVVLEADKRFKTITSGLDPTSFADLRSHIRDHVPGFASVSERDLTGPDMDQTGWQGTRFWYYPDSVEIQASLDYRQGAIVKAQFTADAERSRSDFESSTEFEKAKKARLSPSIQANIKDLNQNYSLYAEIFPELRELSAVARLMGVCIWLQKSSAANLDLDELLTVELPLIQTPREKKQLVSASKVEWAKSGSLTLSETEKFSVVHYLTPALDKTVSEAFPTDKIFARYLAEENGDNEQEYQKYLIRAQTLRQLCGNERVSGIISNINSLQAFASTISSTIEAGTPPGVAALNSRIDLEESEIKRLKAKLEDISSIMTKGSTDVYNAYVDIHNQLVEEIDTAVEKYNNDIAVANSQPLSEFHILEISGGIGLEPEKFKVQQLVTSPILEQTKQVAAMPEASTVFHGEQWVRSRPSESIPSKSSFKLRRPRTPVENHQTPETQFSSASATGEEHYWRSAEKTSGSWHDQITRGKSTTEQYYDAKSRTLQAAEFKDGKLQECIIGKYDGDDCIVFEKSARKDILSPQQPPNWWH